MKVNNVRTTTKVNFDVTDAPTYTFRYGRSFTPDRVEIFYTQGNKWNGTVRQGDRVYVALRGYVGPLAISADFQQGDERPEWVTELVNSHKPADFTI